MCCSFMFSINEWFVIIMKVNLWIKTLINSLFEIQMLDITTATTITRNQEETKLKTQMGTNISRNTLSYCVAII